MCLCPHRFSSSTTNLFKKVCAGWKSCILICVVLRGFFGGGGCLILQLWEFYTSVNPPSGISAASNVYMEKINRTATFCCSLIHKGSPQQVAPDIGFGRLVFTQDALPDATTKGLKQHSLPWSNERSFCLLGECINKYTQEPPGKLTLLINFFWLDSLNWKKKVCYVLSNRNKKNLPAKLKVVKKWLKWESGSDK